MESTNVTKGIVVHTLASWKEFPDFIQNQHANCPAFIYRGQACSEWLVESTLDRLEKKYPTTTNFCDGVPKVFEHPPVMRDRLLKAFVSCARGKRGENPPELSDDEWWALAQHHGLSTPMLDWTFSPFVALFFAFEEKKCIILNGDYSEPEYRVVYVVSTSCIEERDKAEFPSPKPFSPKCQTNYRLINQGGLFLKMPEQTDLESYVEKAFADENYETKIPKRAARAILQKIIIPNADRVDCLKHLNKMNINRHSLFPDLDGAAQYINSLWELDFDTFLGYIPDDLKGQ